MNFITGRGLAIKPGITGMWQVSGRSDITDFEEVVRLDREYIENWSFGLDVKILVRTVLAVVYERWGCVERRISYRLHKTENVKNGDV